MISRQAETMSKAMLKLEARLGNVVIEGQPWVRGSDNKKSDLKPHPSLLSSSEETVEDFCWR